MSDTAVSADYCTRVLTGIDEVTAAHWDTLAATSKANLFVRHAFLGALEASGSVGAEQGWQPAHLTLWRGGRLVGAVPRYAKSHSYGEYVFDWAWADAYRRHQLDYYPKWLVAVPFTPVPGPRLLAIDDEARQRLLAQLLADARDSELSSLHLLFVDDGDAQLLAREALVARRAVQFHWFNRGYGSFEDYLAALTQPKRKKIRAERRKVAEAGVVFERKVGSAVTKADWDFFYRCYRHTYAAHFSTPYLRRRFFDLYAASSADSLLLVIAKRDGQPIASALALFDRDRLYGRYWGALDHVPCLHFETSYYQMIEFAIERNIRVFEGGAQGEHKLARGFEPVVMRSFHWLAHPQFAAAVERYAAREAEGIEAYVDELSEHSALR